MTDDREERAYLRIEAALSRIEAASARAPAPGGAADAAVADLRVRHDRLRDGAAAALARIDRLIAARAG